MRRVTAISHFKSKSAPGQFFLMIVRSWHHTLRLRQSLHSCQRTSVGPSFAINICFVQ